MSTITDLEKKVQILSDKLEDAKGKLLMARLAALDVKLGDIVKNTGPYYEVGKLFRVCKIDFQRSGKPWLSGNPQRENGSYGTARRNLYRHWERLGS